MVGKNVEFVKIEQASKKDWRRRSRLCAEDFKLIG